MDFEESLNHDGTRKKVNLIFQDDELQDIYRSQMNGGVEAIEAIGRAAGSLLLSNGITGEEIIVSPLYAHGFLPETCFSFLGALRSMPGLEMYREDE